MLARQVMDCFVRADVAGPPLPPYFARWAEREQARATAACGSDAGTPPGTMPEFDSFTEQRHWRLGDLDAHLYRVEPTAAAILLVLRGDALAYAAVAGQWFTLPFDRHDRDDVPPNDLTMMCIWHRVEGELDMIPGGIVAVRDQPVHVGFQLERGRYDALDDAQRNELHRACTPIARDAALLFCGWSGPLVITLQSPDPRELGRPDAEPAPAVLVRFDVP